MATINLQVFITIDTDKTEEQAIAAIKKGIYWGLDVQRVAEPKKVLHITCI